MQQGSMVFVMPMGIWFVQQQKPTLRINNVEQHIILSPPSPPKIVMLPDRFGAIAMNSSATFASSYNMSSKKEARQKALRECQYGQKQPCKIFTEYANGCVSFVQGRKGKLSTLIAEGSPERGYAYNKAMNKCSADHDKCTVLIEEECSIAEPPR
ncbi:DUF4189 domain-containing protein [Kingella oralis]|jgi:hypothetical protein|uniref:DUF4189 domain-containing protein n=1 Tax=Kingella oralis TaxID=505 RepID=UPI0034E4DF99